MRDAGADGLQIISAPELVAAASGLAALAIVSRLPTVCEWAEMAQSGCLLGYGPDFTELEHRVANFVALIFRGTAPGELPIEGPTHFKFVINFDAINGEGSAYHGMVEQKSRCITVTYADGTKVDLMPVARIANEPERVGNLFQFKKETGEDYQKVVNPWGFKEHFNSHVEEDPAFYDLFKGRRVLVEGERLLKADTQPMPDHAPLEEKSPRVVAIQLIKRSRDIAFRQKGRSAMRKPPSVVLAAIALDAGPVKPSLVDEVISVANAIREKLLEKDALTRTVTVCNPAYPDDVFTDRWPENEQAQDMFSDDMRRMIIDMYKLRNETLSLLDKTELLKRVFGESVASRAIESQLDAGRHEMQAGRSTLAQRVLYWGRLLPLL
jgi:hypothetical protein